MKKKKQAQKKSKNTLIILTIVCICAIALTATEVVSIAPVKQAAAVLIVPFQKGINRAGAWLSGIGDSLQNARELSERVDELEEQVAALEEEKVISTQEKEELKRLRALYDTDTEYSQYEKVGASVISKDPGNWYSSFMIDKGSDDGITADMNVIAAGGLVGLVTETGTNWARVQAIIDDASSVSAMTVTTQDNCIVNGDLRQMEEGTLSFDSMRTSDTVRAGEQIVTSNISDKYLPGILIGTITQIEDDANHLTRTGTILPAVDFSNLQEVLVIKELKQTGGEDA